MVEVINDLLMKVNPLNPPGEWKGIPEWVKVIMVFIDRVGFPILAFIMISYICLVSQAKMAEAINKNTQALMMLVTKFDMRFGGNSPNE